MNLFHLRYFIKLAQVKHYTRTAELLCITQPSLSHAINQLEAELGVPLFEKNGRNTTLTRFGEEFLVCAEHTLATLDAGVASLQQSAKGEGLIRLGLLRTLGIDYVPRITARFLKENADRDIQFTFHTGVTSELLAGLSDRKYDLIFCSQPPTDLDFTAIPVEKQDIVLIVPRNHPLAFKHSIELSETLPFPQIYFSKGSGMRNVVDNLFSQIDAVPQICYETEEDEVIAGLVAQGFGIAVVPYMDMLLKLDVKIIQISSPVWERNFYMVNDDRAYMSPAVRNFRQFILNGGGL